MLAIFLQENLSGDLRTGQVEQFIDAPPGRMAVGLKADVRHGFLFVAGGFTGQAYVYDLETGAELAMFHLGGLINDVALTSDAAWFTDSTPAPSLSNPDFARRIREYGRGERAGCGPVRFPKPQWHRGFAGRSDPDRGSFSTRRDIHGGFSDG